MSYTEKQNVLKRKLNAAMTVAKYNGTQYVYFASTHLVVSEERPENVSCFYRVEPHGYSKIYNLPIFG